MPAQTIWQVFADLEIVFPFARKGREIRDEREMRAEKEWRNGSEWLDWVQRLLIENFNILITSDEKCRLIRAAFGPKPTQSKLRSVESSD